MPGMHGMRPVRAGLAAAGRTAAGRAAAAVTGSFGKGGDERLNAGAVGVAEASDSRTVDVEDAGHRAAAEERNDDLRARRRIAGDVILERRDVVDHDGSAT